MNFGRVKAVAQKEFLHIIRDPRSLAMALLLPVLMILLFGYGLSLDVDRIPTVIYDSDNSPESRSIATKFQDNRYFDVVGHAGDYPGLQRSIDSGEAMLGLVIPQHFSRDLRAGKSPQIQLLLDGSDSNTASIALGYANTLLRQHAVTLAATEMNRAAGVQRRPAIETHIRIWYNSDLKSKFYCAGPDCHCPDDNCRAADISHDRARMGNGHNGAADIHTAAPFGAGAGQDVYLFRIGMRGHHSGNSGRGRRLWSTVARKSCISRADERDFSFRRALLGNIDFEHCPIAASGLSDGFADHISSGLPAFRLYLCHR